MEWGWLQKGVLRAGEILSSWLGEPGSREAVMAAAALAIGLALAIRALRWQRQRTVSAVLS